MKGRTIDQTGTAQRLVHPLSVVRAERGWTLQDVVDIVAKETHGSARRDKAWRWEHWGIEPDDPSQLALAKKLGVSPQEVHRLGWPGWLPDGKPILVGSPWTYEGTLQSLDNTLEHAMLDRRGFMKLGGPVLVTVAGQWLTEEPQSLAAAVAGGKADEQLVADLEEGLPRLRRLEASLGGERARHLMNAELCTVSAILKEASYSTRVGQRLLGLAAELGRIAGFASFDAGLHAAAQRYWTGALRAAHSAHDRALGANILKSLSLQCYDHGLLNDALALADAAVEGAGPVSPRTRAMLLLRQARAEAACGNRAACDRLLIQAEKHMAHSAPSDNDPAWTGYFDDAEFHAQTGTCHADLGRPKHARQCFDTALNLMPESKIRDVATYRIQAARAHTTLGDTDQAVVLLESAARLITAAPSHRNVSRAHKARIDLRLPKKDPRAELLDRQLATLAV